MMNRLGLFAGLVCLFVDSSQAIIPCPRGFNAGQRNLCVNQSFTEKKTFVEAQLQCRSLKGELVMPLTKRDAIQLAGSLSDDIWLDLKDSSLNDSYMMSNGLDFANQLFDNWTPSGSPASALKNCVSMRKSDARFELRNCSDLINFVCSKSRVLCEPPYVAIRDMCYATLTNEEVTAANGTDQCFAAGGFPPFPKNAKDSLLIDDYRHVRLGTTTILIGFNTTDIYQLWRNMFDQTIATYLPWYTETEPNGPRYVDVYATMVYGSNVKLNNVPPTAKLKFFCQTPPNTCLNLDFSIGNGVVVCDNNARMCKVQCNTGYLLRGEGKANCGVNGVWNENRQVLPLCVKFGPKSYQRMKWNSGVNPAIEVANIVVSATSVMECSSACFTLINCVEAVYSVTASQCTMFGKRLREDEVTQLQGYYRITSKS